MKLSLALVALLAAPARCLTVSPSPTLDRLAAESDRNPAGAGTSEAVRNEGATGFTGERVTGGETPTLAVRDGLADPLAVPEVKGTPTYIFTGNSPIKGVTIYTPRLDPTGNAGNEGARKKEPISKTLVYGALGAGAAATIAGLFFPPLLFLGGLLLGAGAVLGYIRHKINGSN